ncbi:50S ribosomal protein L21 [Synechococcus sp. PCC 7336]|uniref:50S ribosomal protein L21 n=1 Tax=Synechococcus sp. PCC 7336 TaxID=195250 RepID=UPI00034DA75B|nr:50S ribosomal protein L21 [Synechococcus sp. PCC 7336]
MTYAIVETGGKQLWAEPGRFYDVELLQDEPDALVELTNVLLVNDRGDVTVGQPYIEQAVVKARVLNHRRGPKVIVYKMKPKKKTRKKNGHRQSLTRLLIESIEVGGRALGAAESEGVAAATAAEIVVEENDAPAATVAEIDE